MEADNFYPISSTIIKFAEKNGLNIPVNEKEVIDLLENNRTHPVAMRILFKCYYNGTLVQRDLNRAASILHDLHDAAENGNILAINCLARWYEKGKGVPKNLEKSVEFLQKGVDLGDICSIYNIAL